MRGALAAAVLLIGALAAGPACADPPGRNLPVTIGRICNLIRIQAERERLSPHFLARLIWKESRFDPDAVSPANKYVRDTCIAFIERKLAAKPELIEKMTPKFPPLASRPIRIDSEDSVFDALLRDNVTRRYQ